MEQLVRHRMLPRSLNVRSPGSQTPSLHLRRGPLNRRVHGIPPPVGGDWAAGTLPGPFLNQEATLQRTIIHPSPVARAPSHTQKEAWRPNVTHTCLPPLQEVLLEPLRVAPISNDSVMFPCACVPTRGRSAGQAFAPFRRQRRMSQLGKQILSCLEEDAAHVAGGQDVCQRLCMTACSTGVF